MKKYAILIPAYNESKHIGDLLSRIRKTVNCDIIVYDDGSTDDTPHIAEQFADRVYVHSRNGGKGKTLIDGIRVMSSDYEFALLMDGDGQHEPNDIMSFINAEFEKYDIIIGSRDMTLRNMPMLRYLTNRVTTLVTSITAGTRTYDSQSGYRMVKTESIMRIPIKTMRFQMESEMLIKAGKMGMRIGSAPVKTIYGDEVSKINPIVDTLRFVRMILEVLWL